MVYLADGLLQVVSTCKVGSALADKSSFLVACEELGEGVEHERSYDVSGVHFGVLGNLFEVFLVNVSHFLHLSFVELLFNFSEVGKLILKSLCARDNCFLLTKVT